MLKDNQFFETEYDLEGIGLEDYFLVKEFNQTYLRNNRGIWYLENMQSGAEKDGIIYITNYEGKTLALIKEQFEEIKKIL